jgi:parallel beta-helix repeat protein
LEKGKMKLKAVSGIILTLIMLTGMLTLAWYAKPAKAATPRIVPDQYPTIQAAINAASNGDIIDVRNGTYLQPNGLWVNKTVTLIGDYRNVQHTINPATTIIKGYGNTDVVYLNATGISISGFTLSNSGSGNNGVSSHNFNGLNIVNNIISGCGTGVDLLWSNNSVVSNNQISNSMYGINLMYCKNDNITSNTISNGGIYCIELTTVTNSYITYNTMSGSFFYGIYAVTSCNGNTVAYNTVLSPRLTGIYFGSSSNNNNINHNYVPEAGYGIYLYSSCTSNSIIYNLISNCSSGIRLYSVSGNNASYNKITYCTYGIELASANNNIFISNWIQNCTYAIHMSASTGNTFYHNNFVNNTDQVAETGANTWNNNYWYPPPPYPEDPHPLSQPWGENDVAVTNVVPSKKVVVQNESVTINVTVVNQGNYTEVFDVTAYANRTVIQTQTVMLASGTSVTLTFTWNITGVPYGNYTISAYATRVIGEVNTTNNTYIDGTVRVWSPHDVAVTNVVASKTIVVQSSSLSTNITVENQGNYTETFNVTVYANTTAITTQTVTLASGTSTNIAFTWNTTGFPYGSYTISAYAHPVPGETNTANNIFVDGNVLVTIPGDFNDDGVVNSTDFTIFLAAYGTSKGQPAYNSACDLNHDGKVNSTDFVIFLANYGKSI